MSHVTEGPTEEEIYEYLDWLRASGETNMFGAGPYLQREFGMQKKESHEWLGKWMSTYSERHKQ
jgi:hypothetical protein